MSIHVYLTHLNTYHIILSVKLYSSSKKRFPMLPLFLGLFWSPVAGKDGHKYVGTPPSDRYVVCAWLFDHFE